MAPKASTLLVLLAAIASVSATSGDIHAPASDTFVLAKERLSCPKCDGIRYTTNNGYVFEIECPAGKYYPPLPAAAIDPAANFRIGNFEECIHECSEVDSCQLASYLPDNSAVAAGGECLLRSANDPAIDGAWVARKLFNVNPTSSDTATQTATTSDDSTATTTGDSTSTTTGDSTATTTTGLGLPTGLPTIPSICLTTLPGTPLPEECTQVCLDFIAIPGATLPAFCLLIPSLSIPPIVIPTISLPGVPGLPSGLPTIPTICLTTLPGTPLPEECTQVCNDFLAIPGIQIPSFCLLIPSLSIPPVVIPTISVPSVPGSSGLPTIPAVCLTLVPGTPLPAVCTAVCDAIRAIPGAVLPTFCPAAPGSPQLPTIPAVCLTLVPGLPLPAVCTAVCDAIRAIPGAALPTFCPATTVKMHVRANGPYIPPVCFTSDKRVPLTEPCIDFCFQALDAGKPVPSFCSENRSFSMPIGSHKRTAVVHDRIVEPSIPTALPEIPVSCVDITALDNVPGECIRVCISFLHTPLATLPAYCREIPEIADQLETPLPTLVEPEFPQFSVIPLPAVPQKCLNASPGTVLPARCAKVCQQFNELTTDPNPPFCNSLKGLMVPNLDDLDDDTPIPGFTAPSNPWPEVPPECLKEGAVKLPQCLRSCANFFNIPHIPVPEFCLETPSFATVVREDGVAAAMTPR